MSTIYLSLNQPITTKYLKQDGEASDITEMKEDIEELKQDVAGIEEVDEAQNTAITNLQTSDTAQNTAITNLQTNISSLQTNISTHTTQITNLQTSDTAQNAYIDKMKHEIILLSGYGVGVGEAKKEDTKTPMVYVVEKNMDRGNNAEISTTFCAKYVHVNDVATNPNMTLKFGSPNNIATDTEYYYYTCPDPALNGFYIVNGFGEDVLNSHIVKINDVPSNQNYILLKDLMRLYGTSYYQQHYNDVFYFDYLPTTSAKILNLSEWLKTYYTSSDFESMTNLKNWVESKASGSSRLPYYLFLKSGITTPYLDVRRYYNDSAMPVFEGQSAPASGYYINFPEDYTSFIIISMKQGETCPSVYNDPIQDFFLMTPLVPSLSYDSPPADSLIIVNNDGSEIKINIRDFNTDTGSTPQVYVLKFSNVSTRMLQRNTSDIYFISKPVQNIAMSGSNIHYYTITGTEGGFPTPTTLNED